MVSASSAAMRLAEGDEGGAGRGHSSDSGEHNQYIMAAMRVRVYPAQAY